MKTLYILHGWNHSAVHWREVRDILSCRSSEFDVRTIDFPGFGREPLSPQGWSIPEYSQWLFEKIEKEHLESRSVIFLAHSFGGRVAVHLAERSPCWLHSIILYGAPILYRPTALTRLKKAFVRFLQPLRDIIPMFLRKSLQSDDLKVLNSNINLRDVFRNVVMYDQTERWRSLTVQTTLLWGENDTQIPLSIAKEMVALRPNTELVVLPKLGHNAHLENPNLFAGVVRKILDS